MAKDCYIKLDDIEGQSKDSAHKSWIDVLDFSHESFQTVASAEQGKVKEIAGRGILGPVVFKHFVDDATPKIQCACMSGTVIKSAILHVCGLLNKKQEVFYELKLEKVVVTSAEIQADDITENSVSRHPVETVSLQANKIVWKVFRFDAMGKNEGILQTTFNQIENRGY